VCAVLFSGAVSAAAQDLPSPEAQQQILQLLEHQAVYRNQVDWKKVRADLHAASGDPVRARGILREAISRSTGGHGRWIGPSEREDVSARARAFQRASTQALGPNATSPRIDAASSIGVLVVRPYLDDPKVGAEVQQDARTAAAHALRETIKAQADKASCGWIVDLRHNAGGNMWPMLSGLAPVLRTSSGGEEVLGMFTRAEGRDRWVLKADGLWAGEHRIPVRVAEWSDARVTGLPVAVLIGPKTASSGEAVALAFRGRARSRSFGGPTAGFSTANQPTHLVDGSILLLTGALMADRKGRGDGHPITPDVPVNGGDAAAAARTWLLGLPECRRRDSRPSGPDRGATSKPLLTRFEDRMSGSSLDRA